jgi:hypothetical protein
MRRKLRATLALAFGLTMLSTGLGGCAKPACCRGHLHICLSCG